MNETMKSLQYETKALDVTKKGIVTVAVNGIGIEDYQHDISMPGSFVETLKNDILKMRWFLNHDMRQLLGVPLSGEEKDGNVIMTGQLNLDKQIGRDILADYILYHEAGRTLEHSIGVKALARDKEDRRKVTKWQMMEYSTLTGWGANPNTYLVGLKSATSDQIRDAADFIRLALKQHGYSDERLTQYDMELNLMLKALAGGTVVACPCCGHQFDYDIEPEHTFSQEVQEAAAEFVASVARNEARRQMEQYRPEIQSAVTAIVDGIVGKQADLSEKSVADMMAYVRCPHCWSRVYRSNIILQQEKNAPEADAPAETGEAAEKSAPQPAPVPSFWAQLKDNLNQ